MSDKECQDITGISKATYYRRKKALKTYGIQGLKKRSSRPNQVRKSQIPEEVRNFILKIRRDSPTYGKAKITVILRRDYNIILSKSSVGRILKVFMNKGLINKYAASLKFRRKRKFNKHAKRWSFEKAKEPGDLVQIDHMVVNVNNRGYRHFKAVDPITKITIADIYYNAKANTSVEFLEKVIANMPFKINSIQVDGGSEFMAEFEERCRKENIDLYVLPPKSPKYNGCVERNNRTFREDFYFALKNKLGENIYEIRCNLDKAVDKYNKYRPHQSIGFKTPIEYANMLLTKAS